jgi:pre-mRNA-splicing factor 38A
MSDQQHLIDKISRIRIRECRYWKEHCFGLNAERLVDKAIDLRCIGSMAGDNNRPTPFICLLFKMLQLMPNLEIISEFIHNEEFKYLRALACFYLRLVGKPEQVFELLEPLLLSDYRKLVHLDRNQYEIITMDQFIEELLTKNICCEVALPRLPSRNELVRQHRVSDKVRNSTLRAQFQAMYETSSESESDSEQQQNSNSEEDLDDDSSSNSNQDDDEVQNNTNSSSNTNIKRQKLS